MTDWAVQCHRASKSFGATCAVRDVDFTLGAGSVLALVGENGAGKSTLMNMLSGAIVPDTGAISVASTNSTQRRVSMVHQELSLFGNLTVAENMALDRPDLRTEPAARAAAAKTLAELGVAIDVDARVGDLSVGQRQLVEVAKAIAEPPVLLILDEPTSSLEPPQVALLFAAVRRLSALGTATIFVSHRLEELLDLCQEVLILRDGVQVAFAPLSAYTRDTLVSAMVGREASMLYPDRAGGAEESAPVALELRQVTVTGRLREVSIAFPSGQVTAIAGLEGHGQADLAEVAAGARRPDSGALLRAGDQVRWRSPRDAIRAGVGYVAPDRRLEGLLLDQSITANAMLAAGPRLFPRQFVSGRRERGIVATMVGRLAVKCASLLQPVRELSGGNQQKVLIGRWLVQDVLRVLVLNDPTRGVDVGSRAQIYRVIRDLAKGGVAVVLVSTDLQEILGLADTIHVIYDGRITGRLDSSSATESAVMHLATGGSHRD